MIIYSNFDDLILIMIIYSNLVLLLTIKIFGCPSSLPPLLSLPRGHVDLTASPTASPAQTPYKFCPGVGVHHHHHLHHHHHQASQAEAGRVLYWFLLEK